jgi:dCMP deaminase
MCLRRQVGAIIVKDQQILSSGYNGPPTGFDHADIVGCYRQIEGIPSAERIELCRGIHAEQNAITLAAKKGIAIDGGTLYCTHHPCITCQKMILNAGISRVVYYHAYSETDLILAEALKKDLIKFETIDFPILAQMTQLFDEYYGMTVEKSA